MNHFSDKKYRVLLIRPYFEMIKRELGFLPYEPLGLHYIWSALLERGHEVQLYDCLAEQPQKTKYLPAKDIYRCGSDEKDILKKSGSSGPILFVFPACFLPRLSPFSASRN